ATIHEPRAFHAGSFFMWRTQLLLPAGFMVSRARVCAPAPLPARGRHVSQQAQDVILAIDNGTQSVRALLIDPEGNILAKSRVPIEAYYSEQPGWAEQQPEYFWTSLCQACQQLWQQTDIPKAAIKGVTITTQRATVINLDREGKPLRPAIIWLDQRRTKGVKPVGGLWGLAF